MYIINPTFYERKKGKKKSFLWELRQNVNHLIYR